MYDEWVSSDAEILGVEATIFVRFTTLAKCDLKRQLVHAWRLWVVVNTWSSTMATYRRQVCIQFSRSIWVLHCMPELKDIFKKTRYLRTLQATSRISLLLMLGSGLYKVLHTLPSKPHEVGISSYPCPSHEDRHWATQRYDVAKLDGLMVHSHKVPILEV